MRQKKNSLFFTIVFFFLSISSYAQDIIELVPDKDFYNVTSYSAYLIDTKGEIELENLTEPEVESRFIQNTKHTINFGFTTNTYWFKLKMKYVGRSDPVNLEIPWPHIDYLDLYIIGKQQILAYRSGRLIPYNERIVKHKNFVFEIPFSTEEFNVYIKVRSDETLIFPILIHDTVEFHQKDRKEEFILGIYYGIVLVMFFYNLFIYLSLRDKNYLIYLFYVIALGLYQLSINGIIFQYWPDYPIWNKLFLPISQMFLQFCLLLLFKNVLNINSKDKLDNALVNLLLSLLVLFTLAIAFLEYSFFIQPLNALGILYMLSSVSLTSKRVLQGNRTALFFLLTWITFFLGGIILTLRNFGILPPNFLTTYSLQIGSTIEMVLLSIALADRINTMKNELAFLNARLEEKVIERTMELTGVLKELQKKNASIESELELASDVQKCIMPATEIILPGIELAAYYQFYTQVGGDYYDVFPLSNGAYGILIADVSGHGIPAALLTTMAKISFMNSLSKTSSPVEVFREVDANIAGIITTQNYLTAFLLVIHPDGRMFYSSAGHRPPIIFKKRTDTFEELRTEGLFLGILQKEGDFFREKEMQLYAGDRILLYTDGIIDACNSTEDRWGEENLIHAYLQVKDKTVYETRDYILKEWREFMGTTKIIDDSSLIILEYKGIEEGR